MRVMSSPEARLGTASSAHARRRIFLGARNAQLPSRPPMNPPYATRPPLRSGEEVPDRLELVEVRDDVEDARARERRERGDDVAVGHRLLRETVSLGERQREVPADDERGAEHDAVRVDGDVRRLVARRARHIHAAAAARRRDDGGGDRIALRRDGCRRAAAKTSAMAATAASAHQSLSGACGSGMRKRIGCMAGRPSFTRKPGRSAPQRRAIGCATVRDAGDHADRGPCDRSGSVR